MKKQWIEALTSGKYLQGEGKLKENNRFCCLGVLCDIVDPLGWSSEAWEGKDDYCRLKELPYKIGDEFFKVKNSSDSIHSVFGTLASLNDSGTPFKKIAVIIDDLLEDK